MPDTITSQETAESVRFWVPGRPMAWHVESRIQYGGKGAFAQMFQRPGLRVWKRHVSAVAAAYRPKRLLAGPVRTSFLFVMKPPTDAIGHSGGSPYLKRLVPTTKPDVTNLVKSAEDALKGIVWHDDSQVVDSRARKVYADPAVNQVPGVWVQISELTPEDIVRIAGREAR